MGIDQVQRFSQQGLSQRAITRQMGLHRHMVKQWLQEIILPAVETEIVVPPENKREVSMHLQKMNETLRLPAPLNDWDEVHQIRGSLQEYRFLFVKQPQH